MKNKLFYTSLFPLLPIIYLIILSSRVIEDPEQMILGTWDEVSWRYEKMDHRNQSAISLMDELDDRVKSEIAGHLVIHKAEVWQFTSDRKLGLNGKDENMKKLSWALKGRGNILELTAYGCTTETYQIQELTKDRMILHFNSDLQVRGIVEMAFKRRTH